MTVPAFKQLVALHYEEVTMRGSVVPGLTASERFAYDLYRAVRTNPQGLQYVLNSVISPSAVEDGLICVRAKLTALEFSGTCDPELTADWLALEATLVALLELCTGAAETR